MINITYLFEWETNKTNQDLKMGVEAIKKKMMCRSFAISIKIPAGFLTKMDKFTLKFIWECKGLK